ncbi:MAG: ERAP1-like C-terminal domain-containing protein, partial [Acidobacteriaceae bacterium]
LRKDPSAGVIEEIAQAVYAVDDRIATSADRKLLAAWVRQQFRPAYDRVKNVRSTDSVEQRQLRATLFGVLGEIGHDPQIISEAKKITEKYLANDASVEPSLVRPAIRIATENGDSHLFDQLQQLSKTSNNPEVQTTALFSLATFHNPELLRRAFDYATSGKVRNQDSAILFIIALRDRDARPIAWEYIQKNWDKVHAQLTTMMGGALVGSTGGFCSAEKGEEVKTFFAAHPVAAAETAIKRAANSIHDCTVLRATQQPNLAKWLSGQDASAAQ